MSGTSAAAGGDRTREAAAAAATVPDPVVTASAVPDSVVSSGAALPAVSSAKCYAGAEGRPEKKRTINAAEAVTAAKKKYKATSEHDLPPGVYKKPSAERFESRIQWGRKQRYIGTFDTPEQASAAFMSVKKALDDAEACGAHEVEVVFDEAKKNSLAAFGGFVAEERDLPQGVRKTQNGKYDSRMHWRGKQRTIGTFDTPEQASAAFMLVRRDLDDAKLRPCGSDNAKSAIFDAAKNKALEAVIATR